MQVVVDKQAAVWNGMWKVQLHVWQLHLHNLYIRSHLIALSVSMYMACALGWANFVKILLEIFSIDFGRKRPEDNKNCTVVGLRCIQTPTDLNRIFKLCFNFKLSHQEVCFCEICY